MSKFRSEKRAPESMATLIGSYIMAGYEYTRVEPMEFNAEIDKIGSSATIFYCRDVDNCNYLRVTPAYDYLLLVCIEEEE